MCDLPMSTYCQTQTKTCAWNTAARSTGCCDFCTEAVLAIVNNNSGIFNLACDLLGPMFDKNTISNHNLAITCSVQPFVDTLHFAPPGALFKSKNKYILMNLLAPCNDAYLPQFYDALMATNQKPY